MNTSNAHTMKTVLTLFLLTHIVVAVSFSNEVINDSIHSEENVISFANDNIAALQVVYLEMHLLKVDDRKQRERIAQSSFRQYFSYWYQVHKNGVPVNERLELFIALLVGDYIVASEDREQELVEVINRAFNDPFQYKSRLPPDGVIEVEKFGVKGEGISLEEYFVLVSEFKTYFLERSKRFNE